MSDPQLMTQTDARVEARRYNAEPGHRGQPVVAIAHTWPPGCWGGTERGWTVTVVALRP